MDRVYTQTFDKYNIWIRTASKYYDQSLYPGKALRSRTSVPDYLRHRFPVAKAAIETKADMEKYFQRDEGEIRAEFDKRLRREVNFAINIEGKK